MTHVQAILSTQYNVVTDVVDVLSIVHPSRDIEVLESNTVAGF